MHLERFGSMGELDAPFFVECLEQCGESNISLVFGQKALKLLSYHPVQGRSNHRLMVLIILYDLTSSNADAQLHPTDRRSVSRLHGHPGDCDFVEDNPPLNERPPSDFGTDVFDLDRYFKR
jgi:hypothetical protein